MENSTNRHKRVSDWAVLAVFVAAMVAPSLGTFVDLDPTPKLNENRKMAERPPVPKRLGDFGTFSQKFEKFWGDAFGFRRLLIRANALMRYRLGVSSTPLVLIGKHKWLYYTGEWSLDTYRGLRTFSDAELRTWVDELQARSDWMARRGGHYLFVIAPNKQSIYPENIPDQYTASPVTPLNQLAEVLKRHSSVTFVDLRTVLADGKSAGDVFWRTDTHFSDRGSFLCYSQIVRQLKEWYPALPVRAPSDFKIQRHGVWSGDMAAMLGLTGTLTESRLEWVPQFALLSRPIKSTGTAPKTSIQVTAWQSPKSTLPRAVIFNDSFWITPEDRNLVARTDDFMIKHSAFRLNALLAEPFSRALFTWQHDFDPALIEREQAQVVIQELAERWIVSGPEGKAPTP